MLPQNVSMVLDIDNELSWLLCNTISSEPLLFPLPRLLLRRPYPLLLRHLPRRHPLLAVDSFRLGQSNPLSTMFGCMTPAYSSTSGGDDSATAGLLSMNRGSISFVIQIATQRFSYCIADRGAAGVLLLGDAPPSFLGPLNYTRSSDLPPAPLL